MWSAIVALIVGAAGQADCGRVVVAGTWLEVYDRDWMPDSVRILLPSNQPTPGDLRRIIGMD